MKRLVFCLMALLAFACEKDNYLIQGFTCEKDQLLDSDGLCHDPEEPDTEPEASSFCVVNSITDHGDGYGIQMTSNDDSVLMSWIKNASTYGYALLDAEGIPVRTEGVLLDSSAVWYRQEPFLRGEDFILRSEIENFSIDSLLNETLTFIGNDASTRTESVMHDFSFMSEQTADPVEYFESSKPISMTVINGNLIFGQMESFYNPNEDTYSNAFATYEEVNGEWTRSLYAKTPYYSDEDRRKIAMRPTHFVQGSNSSAMSLSFTREESAYTLKQRLSIFIHSADGLVETVLNDDHPEYSEHHVIRINWIQDRYYVLWQESYSDDSPRFMTQIDEAGLIMDTTAWPSGNYTDFILVNNSFIATAPGENRQVSLWHISDDGKVVEKTWLKSFSRVYYDEPIHIERVNDAVLVTWHESIRGSDRVHSAKLDCSKLP